MFDDNVERILQLDIIDEKSNFWVTHCTLTWLLQEGCDDFSDIGIVVFDVMPKVGFVTDDIISSNLGQFIVWDILNSCFRQKHTFSHNTIFLSVMCTHWHLHMSHIIKGKLISTQFYRSLKVFCLQRVELITRCII